MYKVGIKLAVDLAILLIVRVMFNCQILVANLNYDFFSLCHAGLFINFFCFPKDSSLHADL